MAGHSQFKNIMHRKGAQDAKRAKLFTRLQHEIFTAARAGGCDPNSNARLRTALLAARQANVPKDNIERTLKKFSEDSTSDLYTPLRYEGFGPENVAIIVEVLTDNRNRTASDIRKIFTRNDGKTAESNAASFSFSHVGCLEYTLSDLSRETFMLKALEAGADDFVEEEATCTIFCPKEQMFSVQEKLEPDFGAPTSAQWVWRANTLIPIEDPVRWADLQKLLEALDDQEDVQAVWHNGTCGDT